MELIIRSERYIAFNSSGEIESISARPHPTLETIKVNYEDVRGLMEGKDTLTNFKVEYDFIDKKYKLKNTKDIDDLNTVSAFLYEIPSSVDDEFEIKLIKDNKERQWKLVLNQKFVDELLQQGIEVNISNMFFSVTKKNDPNILYRLLNFTNSTEISFENETEFDIDDISVYTARRYSVYQLEVI